MPLRRLFSLAAVRTGEGAAAPEPGLSPMTNDE